MKKHFVPSHTWSTLSWQHFNLLWFLCYANDFIDDTILLLLALNIRTFWNVWIRIGVSPKLYPWQKQTVVEVSVSEYLVVPKTCAIYFDGLDWSVMTRSLFYQASV